jgi:hypothetical protein
MRYYTQFVILLLALYLSACQPPFEPVNYDYSAITPPIKGVTQKATTIKVDPTKPKVVHLDNGSSLSIPKEAFVDANGNTIKGEVELHYRQFDNAAEIITSGIPMTYQSQDGQQQQLQSGGMFELKGTANGKPIFIAPNKSIQTNLASEQVGDYDFYYLNPTATDEQYNWEKLTNEVDIATSKKGIDSFQLQLDIEKHPELSALQNTQWQLADNNPSFNPNETKNKGVLEKKWEVVSLSQPKYKVTSLHNVTTKANTKATLTDNNSIKIEEYSYRNDGATYEYNWEGKLLKNTPKEERIKLTEELYVDYGEDYKLIISNKAGEVIETEPNSHKFAGHPKTHQIAYTVTTDPVIYDLVIADKNGTTQHKIKDIKSPDDSYSSVYLETGADHIIVSTSNMLKIYTWDGKLLYDFKDFDKEIISPTYAVAKENYLVLFEGTKEDTKNGNNLILWDFAANKIYTPPSGHKAEPNNYAHDFYLDKDVITYKAPNNSGSYIWNFKTNTIKKLDKSDLHIFDQLEEYIGGREQGKYAFFDWKGNKKIEFDGLAIGEGLPLRVSADGNHIVTFFEDGEAKLYNRDFEPILDLREYDTEIEAGFFYKGNQLVTHNPAGQLTYWDYEGNLQKQLTVDCPNCYFFPAPYDSTIIMSSDKQKQAKIWSPEGHLLHQFTGHYPSLYNSINKAQILLQGNWATPQFTIADINQPIKDTSIYQLSLYSKNKTYYTYIYLDSKTKRAYDQYQSIIQTKQKKKAQAQKREQKLIRSFAINNFGIYNWDRFYKVEDELLVKCTPNFNLPEIEANQTSIFLITGENRNTVINYSSSDLDKFSFQPALYNQLLAILPDGEIAIFSDEDFKKLDIASIKSSKKHTFQMQKKGGIQALEELEKVMKVNDTAT